MSRKKISSTVYITPEQNERLKLLHERTKVPISVYIREGIDLVLKQYESVLPGQVQMALMGDGAAPKKPTALAVAVRRRRGSAFRAARGRRVACAGLAARSSGARRVSGLFAGCFP
jgi:hypothetical protein